MHTSQTKGKGAFACSETLVVAVYARIRTFLPCGLRLVGLREITGRSHDRRTMGAFDGPIALRSESCGPARSYKLHCVAR